MKSTVLKLKITEQALWLFFAMSIGFGLAAVFPPASSAQAADCWCRKPDTTCEHHATSSGVIHCGSAPAGASDADQLTYCNNYCAGRGGGTWRAAYCDSHFIDRTEGGNGSCPTSTSTSPGTTEPTPAASVELYNPLGSGVTLASLIGRGIRAVIGVVGAIALLMFIYGGIMWMASGGSEERISTAKNILKNATIGLLLIFFSYTIITIFFDILAP